MNLKLDFDLHSAPEIPDIYIGSKTYVKLACLPEISDFTIILNLNQNCELSFSVRRLPESSAAFDLLTDGTYLFVQKYGWFIVSIVERNDGINEYKDVQGYSSELELSQLNLYNLEINADEISDPDYVPVKFFLPDNPDASLLHRILKKAPGWTVQHVDLALYQKQRSFSENEVSVYDFLTGPVSEQFHCLFLFDTFHRTLSAYDLDTFGQDTSLYFDYSTLVKECALETDWDSVKNCFYVSLGDGMNLSEVNPNGTSELWYFTDSERNQMSGELQTRLAAYDVLYESKQAEYLMLMTELQSYADKLLDYYTKVPAEVNSEDWTQYGLTELQTKEKSFHSTLSLYISWGYGDTDHNNYSSAYLPLYHKIKAVEAEIKIREAQIAEQEELQASCSQMISDLQKTLHLEHFLGTDLMKELSYFRRESHWSNDNFSVADDMTDKDRIDLELEALEMARNDLMEASEGKRKVTVSMASPFAMQEFLPVIDQLQLGSYIRVGYTEDRILKLRLTSIRLNFNKIEEAEFTFSDMTRSGNDMKDIIDQAKSMATSYNPIKQQVRKNTEINNFTHEVMKNGLNAALVDIKSGDNNVITLDGAGLTAKKWNFDKQDYEPEQLKITGNLLAYTRDNWNSVISAFGKVKFGDGCRWGLIAETVCAPIVLANDVSIYNDSSSIVLNENGASFTDCGISITSGPNTLTLNPDIGLEIKQNRERTVWLDADGMLHLNGDGSGLDITANKTITGLNENLEAAAQELSGKIEADVNGLRTEYTNTLKSYSTTTMMNSAISQSAEIVTTTVNKKFENYSTTQQMSSAITQKANEITSTVNNTLKNYSTTTQMNSAINQSASSITQTVKGQITTLDGKISSAAAALELCVKYDEGGKMISAINASADTAVINIKHINMKDAVVSWGNVTDRPTVPDTNTITQITRNAVTAEFIEGLNVTSQLLTSIGTSIDNSQTLVSIKDGNIFLEGYNNYIRARLSEDSAYEFSKVLGVSNNGNIVIGHDESVSSIYGGHCQNINMYTNNLTIRKNTAGSGCSVQIYGALTINGSSVLTSSSTVSNAAYAISAGSSETAVKATNASNLVSNYGDSCYITSQSNLNPTNASMGLGSNVSYWDHVRASDVYNSSGIITSSDRTRKKDITPMSESYLQLFDCLTPVTYRFINGTSGRLHTGFIAQDVESAMEKLHISSSDFSGLVKSPVYERKTADGEYDTASEIVDYEYFLRYEDFIPIIVARLQKLEANDINSFNARLQDLERKVGLFLK